MPLRESARKEGRTLGRGPDRSEDGRLLIAQAGSSSRSLSSWSGRRTRTCGTAALWGCGRTRGRRMWARVSRWLAVRLLISATPSETALCFRPRLEASRTPWLRFRQMQSAKILPNDRGASRCPQVLSVCDRSGRRWCVLFLGRAGCGLRISLADRLRRLLRPPCARLCRGPSLRSYPTVARTAGYAESLDAPPSMTDIACRIWRYLTVVTIFISEPRRP